MRNVHAFVLAALLRWRLQLHTMVVRLPSILHIQDAATDEEVWLRFELQQMNDSADYLSLIFL